MGIDSLVVPITFTQGFLSLVVGSIRAKVKAIFPKGLFEVSFDTDETVTLQITKNGLVGTHLVFYIKNNKVLVTE